ncbi:MAG: DUF5716 family protein [Acholeplasmatales bacterium]|nr:DUF5716 family protein [Acholeplasmatales bacterium]
MNFFDMVPDNFFSLLSAKNKRIYLAGILQVFKVYETGSILGIDKKIVVDDLVNFLDSNSNYFYEKDEDDNDEESEEENHTLTHRELANLILRKMEKCGWIYVDVTNDYVELLNFSDAAITICEALTKTYPDFIYDEDELPPDYVNPNEYTGFIYTIYTLLNQDDIQDYGLTFSLVYSNTRSLIRAIRRLESRMKDYIQSLVDNTDIKDLMEKLVAYKNEIYDKSYVKLKISDNIDRYRLSIVTNLESIEKSEYKLKQVAMNYVQNSKTFDAAMGKAVSDIDEVVDAFNQLEEFVTDVDRKNRDFINKTIGKVEFLLNEEDNIVGKLNTLLNYFKTTNKKGKVEKAVTLASSTYYLPQIKSLDNEKSLFTPRNNYIRNYDQIFEDYQINISDLDDNFIANFKSSYNEKNVETYLFEHMIDGVYKASDNLFDDMSEKEFMMVIYSIILSSERGYSVEILNEYAETNKFVIKNFIIRMDKRN